MDVTQLMANTETFKNLLKESETDIWKGSLFEPLKRLSSRSKGAKAEKMTQETMELLKYIVRKAMSSDHDRVISDYATEIKFSTCWDGELNKFTWQQIRGGQDYDRIIFIGCNPNDIHMWWATKDDLKKHVFGRDKLRQHKGKDGEQELYWLSGVHKMPWFRDMSSF